MPHRVRQALAAPLLALALACTGEIEAEPRPTAEELIRPGPHDVAVIHLEELGTIRFELLPELAPRSVAHFIELAESGAYDGTTFHRVIPGFMIQGGNPATADDDPRNDGRGGVGGGAPDEFSALTHSRGVVALANLGRRNTAGNQFFILQDDAPHLDGKHTIIGRVVSGMEVVDAITELEIDTYGRYGLRNRPYPKDARILALRIERAEEAGEAPEQAAAAPPPG